MDAGEQALAEQQVRNLYARYCFNLDGNDVQGLGDCFTEDGVFALSDRGEFVGREAIQDLIRKTVDNRPRHHALNVEVLGVDGGEARSRAYFMLLDQASGAVSAYGYYEDTSRAEHDDTWRFSRRDVTFLWRSGDYAGRASSDDK